MCYVFIGARLVRRLQLISHSSITNFVVLRRWRIYWRTVELPIKPCGIVSRGVPISNTKTCQAGRRRAAGLLRIYEQIYIVLADVLPSPTLA
jgi:hypothetical protein